MAITISLDTTTPYIGRECTVSISGFKTTNAYTLVEWSCSGLSGILESQLGFAWDGTRFLSALSWHIPTSIYSKIPNSRSIKVTLTATVSYSDETATQTSSKTITVYCNESDCKPTLDPTFSRSSGDKTSCITDNSNLVIGGVTKFDITTNAQAVNGASISRQYISIPNGEETNLTNGAITSFGVKQSSMFIVVVDSRGFVSNYSKSFSPYAHYEPPTISLNVGQMNTSGEIPITIKGSYWDFPDYYKDYTTSYATNGDYQDCNKPSIYISCVSSGSSVNYAQIMEYGESYSQDIYSLKSVKYSEIVNDNGLYTFEMTATITGLDYTETYDVQARVRDYIGRRNIDFLGSENIDSPISRSFSTPIFDFGKDDFNFNVPVYIKGVEVKGIEEKSAITVRLLADNTSGYSSDYKYLSFGTDDSRNYCKKGTNLSSSLLGVHAKKDMTAIVSGQVLMGAALAGNKHARIIKYSTDSDGNASESDISWNYETCSNAVIRISSTSSSISPVSNVLPTKVTITLPPVLVELKAGEIVMLKTTSAGSAEETIYSSSSTCVTYLTVMEV